MEWLAYFRIEAKQHEQMLAEAREDARVEQRLKDMQGDPYFNRPGATRG